MQVDNSALNQYELYGSAPTNVNYDKTAQWQRGPTDSLMSQQ